MMNVVKGVEIKMKKIGIICAVERELAPYLKVIENEIISQNAMLTFHEGKINGVCVVMLFCGVCKVNAAIATQLLIDKYYVDCVIVSGTAGGMDAEVKLFDTVISTEVCYHDVKDEILTEYHPWLKNPHFNAAEELLLCFKKALNDTVHFGRIATGEAFIDTHGRQEINDLLKPLCVDMETAAVAHVCYVNGIPFIAVRSISDTESESGTATFDENCKAASEKSFQTVMSALPSVAL